LLFSPHPRSVAIGRKRAGASSSSNLIGCLHGHVLSGALAGGRRPEAVRQHLYGPAPGVQEGRARPPNQLSRPLALVQRGYSVHPSKRNVFPKQVHSLHFVIG